MKRDILKIIVQIHFSKGGRYVGSLYGKNLAIWGNCFQFEGIDKNTSTGKF